jgi:serine/threonine-protein kinase HipA
MTDAGDSTLHVVMNGRVIGDIQRTGRRRMRLRYAEPVGGGFTPLSVSMSGPSGRYREGALVPWLEGLLPDRPETLLQWRRRFGVTDDNPFALLRHVGEDVAGAAQFVRPDRLEAVRAELGSLAAFRDEDVAEMLRRAQANLPLGVSEGPGGKFSLAGAQAKVALHRADGGWSNPLGPIPSTHILKPAIPGMADQDLVEAVTMRTATHLGLQVARTEIVEFAGDRAVVIERYDRVLKDGRWRRVHQEDMCQALGRWPVQKYESQGGPGAGAVADLISRVSTRPEEDSRRFAQALVFNWLVCGTDAHARNYSLLLSGDTARLAPLYDLNSHLAYSDGRGNDLSMSVSGTFRAARVTPDGWVRVARELHVDPEWMRSEIDRQTSELVSSMRRASESPDVARYASPVIERLLVNVEAWLQQRAGAS